MKSAKNAYKGYWSDEIRENYLSLITDSETEENSFPVTIVKTFQFSIFVLEVIEAQKFDF